MEPSLMVDTPAPPSYLALATSGELDRRAQLLDAMLHACRVCPHSCGVDRRTELGHCGCGAAATIACRTPHFGEEPIISGERGSGTVFLAGCNLRCVYCQNHNISQAAPGTHEPLADHELAHVFLELQEMGCHNLNWVSPSHQVPQLVRALSLAARQGLRLPIVYNSNAYEALQVLRLLDGIVDIYLPDLRYADAGTAQELSQAPDYPMHARAALTEMYRQVGHTWTLAPDGTLHRGLLIRLLVLPNSLADIGASLRWIAGELSPHAGISLMAQYFPTHLAVSGERYPLLGRTVSHGEWARALDTLDKLMAGDHHFVQDLATAPEYYRPDFTDTTVPFKDIRDFSG